ncbi:MAG: methylenetetrahydrofolate reductase [NAD(P)H] [Planctomycetota bacterium]
MHIADILAENDPTYSFEFFPPKTPEASEELFANIRDLEQLRPSFVDVTYGAGGSTRDLTHDLVSRIQNETKLPTIPHLTCVCHDEAELNAILERWTNDQVGNILALGGDLPRDKPDWDRGRDACRYAADLITFIKTFTDKHGHPDTRGFGIGVAGFPEGHPATPNRMDEMDHLKAKVDAGADYICTQLFFDNHDFEDFRDRCELAGITIPIVAGIMPITSTKGMRRMAELAAGSRYPAALLRALARAGDDQAAVERVGIHWATEQCRGLLDAGVAGLHFYTLNKSDATRRIYQALGVGPSAAVA